jgi:biotin-dependent carboxylase-like uncharacterized protein
MLEIVKSGLETSVQELPGRVGHWEQGFPPSGPADQWSFRLANLLVGNSRDTAALEWQFLAPTIRFQSDCTVALTGAEQLALLDGQPVSCWHSVHVRAGQLLTGGAAKAGARGYLAISGGIETPQVLGSRATFHMAGIGGLGEGALKAGDLVPLGRSGRVESLLVKEEARPPIDPKQRKGLLNEAIAVMAGPNDAWLDQAAVETFLNDEWTVQARSNRTGIRLSGPALTFSPNAFDKPAEHGSEPSNILDHGYPIGGVSIAGQTPIVFTQDAPSAGGFMVPFTVPRGELWRLGQLRPAEKIRFRLVSRQQADALRREIDALCTEASLVAAFSSQ